MCKRISKLYKTYVSTRAQLKWPPLCHCIICVLDVWVMLFVPLEYYSLEYNWILSLPVCLAYDEHMLNVFAICLHMLDIFNMSREIIWPLRIKMCADLCQCLKNIPLINICILRAYEHTLKYKNAIWYPIVCRSMSRRVL